MDSSSEMWSHLEISISLVECLFSPFTSGWAVSSPSRKIEICLIRNADLHSEIILETIEVIDRDVFSFVADSRALSSFSKT